MNINNLIKYKFCKIFNWFIQVVLSLNYLHQRNIIHRDLKLQNLFLSKEGLVLKLNFFNNKI